MGPDVVWVRYGREAAAALRDRIALAKAGDPLAPVTVVVPTNHLGVASRRLLASGALGAVCQRGRGLASVTFVTPYRLAELLGAPRLASAGRRPVSTPVIAAALRRALAHDAGVFGPVARHPATEQALVAAYRELRDLSPVALDAVAATGRRAADVVRLHRAARAWLERHWYDEEDLMDAAAEHLAAGGGGVIGALVVYLPQRCSRHTVALLDAAARCRRLAVIAGLTGDERADADVERSVSRLAPDGLPPPAGGAAPDLVSADRTRVVSTSDADEEARAAVRAVVDAARRGVPLDRIAILYASAQPYARLVHEHLGPAGIPANGAAVVPTSARMAGRLLLDLLALPDAGFRRQDVLAWLTASPVLHHGRWAPVNAWERLSRTAGVVSGRRDWDHRLARLADSLASEAALARDDPEAPPWRAERLSADSRHARELRGFVLGLLDDLQQATERPRRWSEHAHWAGSVFRRLLGGVARRERWPVHERTAAERVERALARLAALDQVEGPVDLDVFTRTLRLELDADLGRVGRLGEGVLVASVAMGVGLDLDLVVVLGLAEGAFPSAVHDDSLLPDHEREAAGGELTLRTAQVDVEHRQLLAVLGGARQHLLCLPRGDLRRSTQRTPSRWLVELASLMARRALSSRDLAEAQAPWIAHVASFDAGLRASSFAATEQEHRLKALTAGQPVSTVDGVLGRGAQAVAARASDRFTRFDGNVGGLAIPSPVDGVTSATRLERWSTCPMAYFHRELLGVEPVDNPEERLRITPLDLGALVHTALERFFREVLARPEHQRPGPDQLWGAADRARLEEIADDLGRQYEAQGLTGKPIFWQRDRARILHDLRRFLEVDDEERRAHGTRPVAAELDFGFDRSTLGPVALTLADGRTISFRGKADRLDTAADGSLHVIDYKTGRTSDYTSLREDDPDQAGRRLQLSVYGAAAQLWAGRPEAVVLAEYWFITTRGEFRTIGYGVTPAVLARVGQTLATVTSCIEAGVFPAHPTATATARTECEFCDPDGLGVTQLRRQWQRKRTDPALSPYAQLAEPQPEVGAAACGG